MQVPKEVLMKFPVMLRSKIEEKEIEFPDKTEFNYDDICAYRCITRKKSDYSAVTREDFCSNAELGRKVIKGESRDLEKVPEYYGVSLYQDKKELIIRLSLPQKNRKIVKGSIYQQGGPILKGHNKHICWWLYENADVSGFEIESEEE